MPTTTTIESKRLILLASTAMHLRTELAEPEKLADLLGATVSSAWPSGEYDRDAMEFFLARFEEEGDAATGWYGWYALAGPNEARALVGSGGYFGPPDSSGTVEIGYSVLPEFQRQGYATEIVRALLAHAFTFSSVVRVVSRTVETNLGSIQVLLNCGFRSSTPSAPSQTVLFEYARAASTGPLIEAEVSVTGRL